MGRKFSKYLIMLCAVPGILLILAAGKAAAAKHVPPQPHAVQMQADNPVLATAEAVPAEKTFPQLQSLRAVTSQRRNVNLKDGLQFHFGGGKIVNILLIGQDAVSDSGARSDTMILCTFNKEAGTITMTSFLRDMYVKIPGHKNNRLNAAYRFGGVKLLNETLHENFGVKVDGNVQVDFACFEKIIDSLGGVTMELTAAEAAFVNDHIAGSELTEGTHRLTGQQALLYARNRYDTDGDFSRTNRQRKLLAELLEACKSKNITQTLRLIQEIRPMITTDISASDLSAYALTLFPMLSSAQILTQAIPVEGAYSYQTIDGKSVLVPDMQKNIQALQESLS